MRSLTIPEPSCWIITEGIAGTENQCIGVAEALDIPFEIKRISLKQPWKTLSPYLKFEQSWSFVPPLSPPWPELVIAAGRKAIAPARYIKKCSPQSFVVFLQDPRVTVDAFDLICVPEHDSLRGHTVLVTKASPNRITETLLNTAQARFPQFARLDGPRIAVLIGGTSKAYQMSAAVTQKLVQDLSALEGTLMMTCSRRTGAKNKKTLQEHFDKAPHVFWDGTGDNPYMGFLAHADYILVTADSASMISDACTTGKPVYMIDLEGGAPRIQALHRNLIERGILKRFTGTLEGYTYKPLNDAKTIAEEIQKCIQKYS